MGVKVTEKYHYLITQSRTLHYVNGTHASDLMSIFQTSNANESSDPHLL